MKTDLGRQATQFLRFGVVGGSGVLVNMATLALCDNAGRHLLGWETHQPLFAHIGPDLIYVWVSFAVAVSWNFYLNRAWTFKGRSSAALWRQYTAFVATGAAANVATTLFFVAFTNDASPLYLPGPWFSVDGAFYTRRLYWGQALAIVLTMPVNFVVNKLWAFRVVRAVQPADVAVVAA